MYFLLQERQLADDGGVLCFAAAYLEEADDAHDEENCNADSAGNRHNEREGKHSGNDEQQGADDVELQRLTGMERRVFALRCRKQCDDDADGAENVIRVKATTRNFREETNMSVITEDGNFYTFNVKYADEPLLLNVEMCDFIHDGESVNHPNNAMEIYLTELDNESPRLVRLIMKSVYENDKRRIRHIGCKRFGIQYLLKGLYTHNDLLYFHTQVKNSSNVPFDVDFITFKVVDKKVMKRTAMQEQVIYPLRAYNYVTRVNGRDSECTVFALPKFTIPDDKKLVVEMYEKQGGRHQSFEVVNEDLVCAETINELKVR